MRGGMTAMADLMFWSTLESMHAQSLSADDRFTMLGVAAIWAGWPLYVREGDRWRRIGQAGWLLAAVDNNSDIYEWVQNRRQAHAALSSTSRWKKLAVASVIGFETWILTVGKPGKKETE